MSRRPTGKPGVPRPWPALALLLLAALWAATAPGAVVFAPPEDSADAATELKGIDRELADQNFPAAAKRLDALLGARADQLFNSSEGTLASVSAWVDQLPPEHRASLAAEYVKSFGTPARQLLESLNTGRVPRPEELYAISRRYPMTQAAGDALAQAGDRSLQLGDFPAAQAYYELAKRENFPIGDERARRLESVKKINAGVTIPLPPDLGEPARGAVNVRIQPGRLPFAGPLPFDAAWFGNPSLMGPAKFLPAAYDDRIILASWKSVTMLRESGQVLWNSPNPKPPGSFSTDRPTPSGRGPLFAPAALCDVYGRPVIIVVRQPAAEGDSQYALRALSAADGKPLWTTETSDPRKDLTYAGLPTVSGRYVYGIAATRTGVSSGNLLLCATDVATGQSLWQTTLGSVNEQADNALGGRGKFGRNQPLSLDSFAELSEPAVAGDLVIIAPNCGCVVAVGRFDGKIRWVHVYRQSDAANPRQLGERPMRWMGQREGERALLTRYKSTPVVCGDVVVAMPQDVPAVFALDRAGGKSLWDTDIIEGFALAGASGNIAVFSGATLCGVDAVTAKLKWKFIPAAGTGVTGPAVVLGQTVLAATTHGVVQLDAANGAQQPAYAVPDFRRLLTTDAGKAAVTEAGAARSFVLPR